MIERLEPTAQYDVIAEDYADLVAKTPLNNFAVYPSLLNAAGDLREKEVLDLACGSGTVAVLAKCLGARRVVGVDESQKMLQIAKKKNRESDSGIKYQFGHVGTLGKIGEFDVETGGFLLHYARTKEELLSMCKDVATNLKPGGTFVAVNNNPEGPLTFNNKYESRVVAVHPPAEGDDIEVIYESGGKTISFKQRFWKKETYERALQESGLVNIEWLPVLPNDEGRTALGNEYWNDFLTSPFLVLIRAQKPKILSR